MTRRFSFSDACAYLFPRTSGPKGADWSLEPTRRLLLRLGSPETHMPCVHIGGSNGKGSVSVMVAEACRAAGFRTGLFTSPHLVDIRERFQVDGQPISAGAFASWVEHLYPAIEETNASFFETTTAIALADFAARGADIAVVEVGLGGRLDSTNVLAPVVSAVTNVSLDHTEYLGNSLEQIAREKAGIAKPDTPFVIGETGHTIAQELANEATRRGAVVEILGPDDLYDGPLGMAGAHQRRNAAVADAVLRSLPEGLEVPGVARRTGFARAWLPGRFHRLGRWVLDVGHNVAGIETLVHAVGESGLPAPVHVVFGALADKNGSAMLERLGAVAARIWVTRPPGLSPDRQVWWPKDPDRWGLEPDFDRALQVAADGAATVIVTGSFYTVAAAMARLPGFRGLG